MNFINDIHIYIYNVHVCIHSLPQMVASMAAEKYEFVGELINSSKAGEINAIIQSSFKSSHDNIAFNGNIFGDIERANVDFKMLVNDQEYTIKIEGTPSSIMIDTYIFKHMLFNAYVSIH